MRDIGADAERAVDSQRQHGFARLHDRARLSRPRQDGAGIGREQRGVLKAGARLIAPGARGSDLRDCGGDVLAPRARLLKRERLLRCAHLRLGSAVLRLGCLELRPADRAGFHERGAPFIVLAGTREPGGGFRGARFGLRDFLRPVAGAALVEFGLGDADLGLRRLQRIIQRARVERGERRPRLHLRTFLVTDRFDPPRNAEGEVDLPYINVAVERERTVPAAHEPEPSRGDGRDHEDRSDGDDGETATVHAASP